MVVRTQMYDNRTTDHDSMLNNGTYERAISNKPSVYCHSAIIRLGKQKVYRKFETTATDESELHIKFHLSK